MQINKERIYLLIRRKFSTGPKNKSDLTKTKLGSERCFFFK